LVFGAAVTAVVVDDVFAVVVPCVMVSTVVVVVPSGFATVTACVVAVVFDVALVVVAITGAGFRYPHAT
jgi:hypothetical protein